MKKKGRHSKEISTALVDGVELRVAKGHGNWAVTLLSTYEAVNPTAELLCWDQKERKKKLRLLALQFLRHATNS